MNILKKLRKAIFTSFFLHTHTHTALPLYSVTRAYCKQLLCETFTALLLPDSVPDEQISSDFALQAFKQTLNMAKEASTTLFDAQSGGKLLSTAAGVSDSGMYSKNCGLKVAAPF